MKVKIGNIVYSSEDIPLMVILTDEEKEQIAGMPEFVHKFAAFPAGVDSQMERAAFMATAEVHSNG